MPDYVKGVINLRGKVIPIVNLRLRFGIEERDYDDRTCIVVAEIDRVLIGLIVDTVEEVMEIAESNIEPPPAVQDGVGQGPLHLGDGQGRGPGEDPHRRREDRPGRGDEAPVGLRIAAATGA